MSTLGDSQAAASYVHRPVGTIRRWAHAGWLKRHGKDGAGRTLYDLEEVQAVAANPTRRAQTLDSATTSVNTSKQAD